MSLPALDSKPLVDLLDRMVVRWQQDEPERARTVSSLAEELGVGRKRVKGWRAGERVDFATADRVLTRAGVLFHDVWSVEEFPEVYEELEGRKAA